MTGYHVRGELSQWAAAASQSTVVGENEGACAYSPAEKQSHYRIFSLTEEQLYTALYTQALTRSWSSQIWLQHMSNAGGWPQVLPCSKHSKQ